MGVFVCVCVLHLMNFRVFCPIDKKIKANTFTHTRSYIMQKPRCTMTLNVACGMFAATLFTLKRFKFVAPWEIGSEHKWINWCWMEKKAIKCR